MRRIDTVAGLLLAWGVLVFTAWSVVIGPFAYVSLLPFYQVRLISLDGVAVFGLFCWSRGFGWRALPMVAFAGAFTELQWNLFYFIPCPGSFGLAFSSEPSWPLLFAAWVLVLPLSLAVAHPAFSLKDSWPVIAAWGAWDVLFYGLMRAPVIRGYCTYAQATSLPVNGNWVFEALGFVALFALWVGTVSNPHISTERS